MKKLIIILALLPSICFSQNWYDETTTYQYDNLNRLIQVDFSDGTTYNYVYDNLGNRIQMDINETSNPIGLNEALLGNTITIYPNPTTGDISIQLPETISLGKINILILDMNGKTVIEKSIVPINCRMTLETKLLESGVYMIEIIDQDQTWSEFFIKE